MVSPLAKPMKQFAVILAMSCTLAVSASAQSLGNAGTVEGTVTDPTGAVIPNASVSILNRITGYQQQTKTDTTGTFRFGNIPPNPYHLEVNTPNFSPYSQDVTVRNSVPISLKIPLTLAGSKALVTVEGAGADILENVPYAHSDMDRATADKLPISSPASGLSDAIIFASPGVVADSNGFFHPLGDHAQTTFVIDGQPISDQQSKQFSTQLPLNAIQSMELITGAPNAEYGDKTSLVVDAVTRSGLGQKAHGDFTAEYGSFGTPAGVFDLAIGSAKFGNFLALNGTRSGRFLDTPEFSPLHARGNNETIFDRIDFQPSAKNAFHLNLFLARNWFQTPNTYDQESGGQDQRQQARTFNIAPGFQHTFGTTLLTINPFYRQDFVNYYGSGDPFADSPATVDQARKLRSTGFRTDVASAKGKHNLKFGVQYTNTGLSEDFLFGLTDPAFNPVCLTKGGDPVTIPTLTDPDTCGKAGFVPNDNLLPGLVPYDLSRNGTLFGFRGRHNINDVAFYAQDQINLGQLNINLGVRVEHYDGLSSDTQALPRAGVSYHIKSTGTVVRAAYSRTMETPYNENLLLSSATGVGGLATNTFGAFGSTPIEPGHRNQYNAGVQQAIGKFLLLDADYFWKYTRNAYDFDLLFNTPITFPISWKKSSLDGVSVRISTTNIHGFQAFTTMGHTRARFFGPENGGLAFNSPVDAPVFRIDHDQAFQQTTHVRYQIGKTGPWAAFTWRYDSGLVAGSVASLDDALALSGDQQAAIGFFCGSQRATLTSPIADCVSSNFGAIRLKIPAPGTADDDHNPPRIAPRHLFDLAVGTDNLLKTEGYRVTLRGTVTNLTNNVALYNFLSTFSGTHFVTPRAYQASIGIVF
jgi:hypothetical protein